MESTKEQGVTTGPEVDRSSYGVKGRTGPTGFKTRSPYGVKGHKLHMCSSWIYQKILFKSGFSDIQNFGYFGYGFSDISYSVLDPDFFEHSYPTLIRPM